MRSAKVLVAVFVFTATSAVLGQKVSVDFDRSIDFSRFKTFGWTDGQAARNPAIAEIIVSNLEKELSSKGLVKNADTPDIKISVLAAIGLDLQGIGPTWNNERYRYYGGRGNTAALVNITTGTLVVDLIEAGSGRLVWRGTASDTLPHSPTADPAADAKDVQKTVINAIKKMVKKYPVSVNK